MTEDKDWLLEEDDPLDAALEEDAGMSVEERLARDEKALDESDEAAEGEGAAEADETGADAVLSFGDDYANERASADVDRAAFRVQVDSYMPDYQPPPEPLSKIEEAAVAAAKFPPGSPEFEALKSRMAEANERLAARYRAGTEGHDSEGAPVEPPFDPMGLSPDAFASFTRAISSGGASLRDVPQGETYDSWSAKVQAALSGGRS